MARSGALTARTFCALLLLSASPLATRAQGAAPVADEVTDAPVGIGRPRLDPETKALEARTVVSGGHTFRALFNTKTGTAEWVIDVPALAAVEDVGAPLNERSVEAKVRRLLTEHAGALGLPTEWSPLFGAPVVRRRGVLWTLDLPQEHLGVPVIGGGVGVTFTERGSLVALGVRAHPAVAIKVQPGVSGAAAVRAATAVTGGAGSSNSPELVVLPVEYEDRFKYLLVWRVHFEGSHEVQEVLVDASDGRVVDVVSPPHAAGGRNDGPKRPHPLTSVGHANSSPAHAPLAVLPGPVSGLAEPHSSEHTAHLTPTLWGYVTVNHYVTPDDAYAPLERYYDQPFYSAKVEATNTQTGYTYVGYADADGYYSIDVTTGDYNVRFSADTRFTSVTNVPNAASSTHTVTVTSQTRLDKNWGWGPDGDGGLSSFALNAALAYAKMRDYSYTFSGFGVQTLPHAMSIHSYNVGAANGSSVIMGGANAMSTEVTYHEFSHNWIYDMYGGSFISGGTSGSTLDQASAMDEAMANYFAADYTNDHQYGGPVEGAEPKYSPGQFAGIQYLYNNCTMNDFYGDDYGCGGSSGGFLPHRRGQIVSGAVWRLRIAIGSPATDLLVYALNVSPRPQTFVELRNRMQAANYFIYGDLYRQQIEQVFTDRYIGGPLEPSALHVSLSGSGQPHLVWADNSSVEDGYRVERRLDSGGWTVLATLPSGSASYTDTYQCTPGGAGVYEYRVVSYVSNHDPAFTDPASYSNTVSVDRSTCGTTNLMGGTDTVSADGFAPGERGAPTTDAVVETTRLVGISPNPTRTASVLRYELAERSDVQVGVFDLVGREVARLDVGAVPPGAHAVPIPVDDLPNGSYVCRLATPTYTATVLLTVVR